MNNFRKTLFTLLTLVLISTSLIACGDGGGGGGEDVVTANDVLTDSYNNFIHKNLDEANEWVTTLDNQSKEYCNKTDDSAKAAYSVTDGKHNDRGTDTIRVPWIELNEYATNRLRMFSYKKFQEDSFKALNNGSFNSTEIDTLLKGDVAGITKDVLKSKNLNGLMPLAYVLYHDVSLKDTDKSANQFDAKRCAFIRASVPFLQDKVKELSDSWEKEKANFIKSSDKGVQEMLHGIATVMMNVDKDELANPAKLNLDGKDDSSAMGSFRAVDSHMTGWLASQSIYRGPQALYVGSYKEVDWGTKSLQAYVKAKKADIDAAITTDFADVNTYLGKEGSLVQKAKDDYDIDFANLNTTQKANLKKAIVAVKRLSDDFEAAAKLH